MKDMGSVYNPIIKPIKKKPINPKLTMNMAGLGGYYPHHGGGQYIIGSNNVVGMNSHSQNMMMSSGVNSTMQVNQKNLHHNNDGGLPHPNQSSHEFKMKHNSSNQSFHSQKKIAGAGGMSTIRKPGGHNAPPTLDNSFNNHHNNSINGGMSVHGVGSGGNSGKIVI